MSSFLPPSDAKLVLCSYARISITKNNTMKNRSRCLSWKNDFQIHIHIYKFSLILCLGLCHSSTYLCMWHISLLKNCRNKWWPWLLQELKLASSEQWSYFCRNLSLKGMCLQTGRLNMGWEQDSWKRSAAVFAYSLVENSYLGYDVCLFLLIS